MITYEGTQLSHPKLEPLHNTRFTIYFYQQPADDSYIPVPQIPLFHTLPQLHLQRERGWLLHENSSVARELGASLA